EAGQIGDAFQPPRVHRQQEEREDHRGDDLGRLAQRPHDRAAGELPDLGGELVGHATSAAPASARASSASSTTSSAPSRLRPVLARKTSSSEGAWSCRVSILIPSPSSARTTSASPESPPESRTAAPFVPPSAGSPKRARTAAVCSRSPGSHGTASTVGR